MHFINTWGQDKVLFGTDFPVIDFERATREIDALDLRPEAKEKLLWRTPRACTASTGAWLSPRALHARGGGRRGSRKRR